MDCEHISNSSPCKIGKCIYKVVGMNSSSSSPTIQLMIDFKKGSKLKGKPIEKGFLKIFLHHGNVAGNRKQLFQGLRYEINFYKEITNPLLENRICPNFVFCIGANSRCNFENIMEVLVGKTFRDNNNISRDELETNFLRALHDSVSIGKKTTAIQVKRSKAGWSLEAQELLKQAPYGFILTEYVSGFSLSSSIRNADDTRFIDTRGTGHIPREGWRMLFQIMAGCYALSLSKAIDNDLHAGNVMIKKYEGPPRIYDIEGFVFELKSGYEALIFDFDNAYAERLGNNPLLDGKRCEVSSHCNNLVPNKDMVKILCYFYQKFNNNQDKATNELLSVLLKTRGRQKTKEFLRGTVYERRCFLLDEAKNKTLPPEIYDQFLSPEEIIRKVAAKAGMVLKKVPDNFVYYRIEKGMFESNGEIKSAYRTGGVMQKFSVHFENKIRLKLEEEKAKDLKKKEKIEMKEEAMFENYERRLLDSFKKILAYCQDPKDDRVLEGVSDVAKIWVYVEIRGKSDKGLGARQRMVLQKFRKDFKIPWENYRNGRIGMIKF